MFCVLQKSCMSVCLFECIAKNVWNIPSLFFGRARERDGCACEKEGVFFGCSFERCTGTTKQHWNAANRLFLTQGVIPVGEIASAKRWVAHGFEATGASVAAFDVATTRTSATMTTYAKQKARHLCVCGRWPLHTETNNSRAQRERGDLSQSLKKVVAPVCSQWRTDAEIVSPGSQIFKFTRVSARKTVTQIVFTHAAFQMFSKFAISSHVFPPCHSFSFLFISFPLFLLLLWFGFVSLLLFRHRYFELKHQTPERFFFLFENFSNFRAFLPQCPWFILLPDFISFFSITHSLHRPVSMFSKLKSIIIHVALSSK